MQSLTNLGSFTPVITLEHADSRGEIYSIELPDGHELMVLHSRAGTLRGGHSHSCGEIVTLLSGKMRYHKRHGIIRIMKAGDHSYNGAGQAHFAEFLEDSWLTEYKLAKKGEWTQTNDPCWRAKVEANAAHTG